MLIESCLGKNHPARWAPLQRRGMFERGFVVKDILIESCIGKNHPARWAPLQRRGIFEM
jgi:hypothetical protein